jgi:hypothetical protein
MWNHLRPKLGIGLSLALAAAALGGTSVLASPAPPGATGSGAATILPPEVGTPRPWLQEPVTDVIIKSPETGFTVRVPAFDSPLAQVDRNEIVIVPSPATGLNVRVPAF